MPLAGLNRSKLASTTPQGNARGFGGTQLARETGLSQTYVSRLLKNGVSTDEIRERGREREKRMKGNAAPSAPAIERSKGYVPSFLRRQPAKPETAVLPVDPPARPKQQTTSINSAAGRGPLTLDGETLAMAQLRKAIADADQKQIEVMVRRGELVDRHRIAMYGASALIGSRDILLRIGPENRDRWAAETDPVRLEREIVAEVRQALGKLEAFWKKLADESVDPTADQESEPAA